MTKELDVENLSASEVSVLVGISYQAINILSKSGALRFHRLKPDNPKSMRLFRLQDLVHWIRANPRKALYWREQAELEEKSCNMLLDSINKSLEGGK